MLHIRHVDATQFAESQKMHGSGLCQEAILEPHYFLGEVYNFLFRQPKHIESIFILDTLNNLIYHPGYNLRAKDQLVEELETGSEEIINKTMLGHIIVVADGEVIRVQDIWMCLENINCYRITK